MTEAEIDRLDRDIRRAAKELLRVSRRTARAMAPETEGKDHERYVALQAAMAVLAVINDTTDDMGTPIEGFAAAIGSLMGRAAMLGPDAVDAFAEIVRRGIAGSVSMQRMTRQ